MTTPIAGVPAWHPDPTGRHEHRWFDGTAFTDRVASAGQPSIDVGLDPGSERSAAPPAPLYPPPGFRTDLFAPPSAPAGAPAATPGSRRSSKLPFVLGGAALVILLVSGAVLVLADDDDIASGLGRHEGTIGPDGDAVGLHRFGLDAGTLLVVELAPGVDLDARIAIAVSAEDAELLQDAYDDVLDLEATDLPSAFADVELDDVDLDEDDQLVLLTDVGFAGEDELLILAVPQGVSGTVVVGPYIAAEDADDYELTLTAFALEVEDGADGAELLGAVIEDRAIPSDARDLAEELLEGL